MIDFHTHTLLSDGALPPSDLVKRARSKGYRAIGFADHVNEKSLRVITKGLLGIAKELIDDHQDSHITIIPGVEISLVKPELIKAMVEEARKLGAVHIIVHGESPIETVYPGTNRAAIEADVDILAHPGFITEEEAALAAKRGVHLEITSKNGHSLTNGHVARLALKHGAKLVINTDTHIPENLITKERACQILKGAGLTEKEIKAVLTNNEKLLQVIKDRMIERGLIKHLKQVFSKVS